MSDRAGEHGGRSLRWTLLARSFLVQGSWNYRTLIGGGLAWVLLPVVRRSEGCVSAEIGPEASNELFNAHPYLSTIAIGALARAAKENLADGQIRRFRSAIRSPLGSLGDQLFWEAWRPLCVIAAMLAAVAGLGPTWTVAGLLLLYNALHVSARIWGLGVGLDSGLAVGPRLARAQLSRHAERIELLGVLLAGFLMGALAVGVIQDSGSSFFWLIPGAAALLSGVWAGSPFRRWTPGILVVLVAVGLMLGSPPALPSTE